jgi:hypothetical protein
MSQSKETKEHAMTQPTKERRIPTEAVPVLVFASVLSAASLAWTTYSLLDLLHAGWIGVTVAATADLIWSAVIWCEYKGIGSKGWVKTIGWLAVVVVGGFIAWHGADKNSAAMAIAGPFLTLGTKAVWEFALIALRDPVRETRAEAKKKIDLLNAETDTILEQSEAQIRKENADSEAEHQRALNEKRRKHELKMADLTYEAEEKRLSSEHRSDLLVGSIENNQFEKIMGIIERQHAGGGTIPGQVVPQIPQNEGPRPLAGTPQAATANRPKMTTVQISEGTNVVHLSISEQRKQRLAALYYLAHDNHVAQHGTEYRQVDFVRQYTGYTKVQLSRALADFPRNTIPDLTVYQEDFNGLKYTG